VILKGLLPTSEETQFKSKGKIKLPNAIKRNYRLCFPETYKTHKYTR